MLGNYAEISYRVEMTQTRKQLKQLEVSQVTHRFVNTAVLPKAGKLEE